MLTTHDERLIARFWSKVAVAETDACWLWTDTPHKTGYGRISAGRGVLHYAHRVSWEIAHGRMLSTDEHIDHLCRVRTCVNPSHLENVTVDENSRRQGAANPAPLTCPKGHEDWGVQKGHKPGQTFRRCMECHRQRERSRRRR